VTEISGNTLKVSFEGGEGHVKATDSIVQVTSSQNVYVVNYTNSDGQQIYMPQYCIEGQEKNVYSNAPKRDKSGFVGWSVLGSDKILLPGDPIGAIEADVALVANWDNNYYVVTFKNTDGTVISQEHGYYGTKYDVPEPPESPEGFVFSGWDGEADGIIRGNASYAAVFAPEETDGTSDAVTESTTETESGAEALGGCSLSVSASAILLSVIVGACSMLLRRKK
jgi:hypothetical protein